MSTVIDKTFNPSISSHGYGDASIFFLTGHPLKEDLVNGLALSGHNETTLNHFLREEKLNIQQCYRSSYIKEKLEYSGTNPKKLANALAKVDLEKYKNLLFEEIKNVLPNVIVPLDDIALSIVFPHINAIKKPKGRKYWTYCYRGSILPLRNDWQLLLGEENIVRIIPTLGPQLLYNDWTARSYTQLDYKRINIWKNSRSKIEEPEFIWVAKDAKSFSEFLKRAFSQNPTRCTFDVETYGSMLTCISFCFDGHESVTVPLCDPHISSGEMVLLWRLVGKVLSNAISKNNQNIKYDWIINDRHGFNTNNVQSDTMLKTGLLYPELPKGLDFLTSIYTNMAYYKDEGKEFNPKFHTRDRLYLYCAKDSLAAHIISEKQDKELEENGLLDLYNDEVAPSILIYKNIDESGIQIDQAQKTKLRTKYTQLYDANAITLRILVNNQGFNPKSPTQVGKLLYEELKFPARKKTTEEGKTSYKTDKETLDDLFIHHIEKVGKVGAAIIARVIVCRKLAKVIEYIDTPLHPDGRFRGNYNLTGTETGRSSCSKTIDERLKFEDEITSNKPKRTQKLGRSLQTISKHGFHIDEDIFDDFEDHEIANDLRSMFVPTRGYVFVECDGSQAEARVVAVLAEDWELLESFDKKPKIHAKTIGMILGIDPMTITSKTPTVPKLGMPYYELGKRIRHAGHNGMEAGRLCQYTHLPYKQCIDLMEKFHSLNPQIKSNFHNPIREIVGRTRELRCPNGRRRDFFARVDDKFYKEALCYIQQATVSDLTKFTMHRVVKELPGYMRTYRFLNENHDGILAEVKKEQVMEYAAIVKKQYERPINFSKCSLSRNFDLIIPVEIASCEDNWMNIGKDENAIHL